MTGPIGAYLTYEGARAEGASATEAVAAAVVEEANPLPVGVMDVQRGIDSGRDAGKKALCEKRRDIMIRRGYTEDMLPECDHHH